MMRFRAVAWCMGVSAAACTLYLISGQVAAERGRLEATETRIALVQSDMRRLTTELGTRGSQRQLEQWNGEVLALSAPKANQYLQGKVQLASLDGATLDRVAGPAQLIAVNATVSKPAPRLAPPVTVTPAPARPADAASNLRYATYTPEVQLPVGRAPATTVRKVAFTIGAPVDKPLAKLPVAKLDVKPKYLTPAPETTKTVGKAGSKPVFAKKFPLQGGSLAASLAKAAKAEGGR